MINKCRLISIILLSGFASHAYQFKLKCVDWDKDEKPNEIVCDLRDSETNEIAGVLETTYNLKTKNLEIEGIEICKKYQARGLSSILLYHGIKIANSRKNLLEVSLNDYSSITDEMLSNRNYSSHYHRYGFVNHAFNNSLSMRIVNFLENQKNIERYSFRTAGDFIDIEELVSEVNQYQVPLCP
jgi:hypothetical protein